MPEGAGLLLDQTWRMHPDLCRFTSEAFYDGKLHGVDGLDRQSILGLGAGLRIVEVAHQGNTNASAEEAREVARLTGCTWRDAHGASRVVGVDDILIVTPYNAQIRAMATSSADLAPRGLEFLYDRHRLNVATSRARALAIIVASPDLIRVSCRTPPQMVLANALCQAGPAGRAWEASR
jgi:AAA domain